MVLWLCILFLWIWKDTCCSHVLQNILDKMEQLYPVSKETWVTLFTASEYNNSIAATWYGAQNECVTRADGGRLAVYSDIEKITRPPIGSYWIGLHYNPWVWIKQGNSDKAKHCIFPDMLTVPRDRLRAYASVKYLWQNVV